MAAKAGTPLTVHGEPLDVETMAKDGATPNVIDADALLKEIQALQARLGKMEQDNKPVGDPIARAIHDLKTHTVMRHSQGTGIDFPPFIEALESLDKKYQNGLIPDRDAIFLLDRKLQTVLRQRHLNPDIDYLAELLDNLINALPTSE